eukprot:362057-Chlamydomonas_euryale.AAC.8
MPQYSCRQMSCTCSGPLFPATMLQCCAFSHTRIACHSNYSCISPSGLAERQAGTYTPHPKHSRY